MSSFRKVLKYNGGVKGEAGIELDGQGWVNVPKGCKMLSPELVGKYVEVEMIDLNGDGNYYINELKIEKEGTKKLAEYPGEYSFQKSSNESYRKALVEEWFSFYKKLCEKIVPNVVGGNDHYAIREMEGIAAREATELLKHYQNHKSVGN